MSAAWLLIGLFLCSAHTANIVRAHEHADDGAASEPAEVAGFKPTDIEHESYIQRHMRTEHHIMAFNLGSAFALHDLDRNGVLDRAEIEAIYGVHHSESKKLSPTHEVHDEKANKIVREVLFLMDKNGDGLVTKQEFIDAGPTGLPLFEEFDIKSLGHHYDEESEFFVHHEEMYHNTPETQNMDTYTHKEDLEHLAKHDNIEKEEEQRERKAEGLPSIEEDQKLRKEAERLGQKYHSPYEDQFGDAQRKSAQLAHDQAAMGNAVQEAEASQHIFKTPSGDHVVKEQRILFQDEEVDNKGKAAHPPAAGLPLDSTSPASSPSSPGKAAPEVGSQQLPHGIADRVPGETEEGRRQRLVAAKDEASRRPSYGQGNKGFAYPKDDADRLKAGGPYKYPPFDQYRVKKKSYFGEF